MAYEPTWESLDRHRAPEWFRDAKFGTFVHYSPSWFGDDGERPVPEAYDAGEWVSLAADAGARYLIFTTKHHDGFCNWPSEHTDFGASTTGGPRDVVSPLADAVRDEGLRLGFYYSWLDRHHPEYPDREAYVREYAHAQLEELVERYDPAIVWGDGEWDHDADHWGAREFAAWYYNRAEREGRAVCLNDRLGADCRYYYVKGFDSDDPDAGTDGRPHGDYWTPEHQVPAEPMDHPFETCETAHDGWSWVEEPNWREPGELVRLLVDVVSKGGNLLLNVGPKPDGSIAEREHELFGAVGEWLSVNGEAIYGTRPLDPGTGDVRFVPDVEWEDPAATWAALQERIDDAGPVRYTRTDDAAYALSPGWPGEKLRLAGPTPAADAAIRLLGHGDPLAWDHDGDAVVVHLPDERERPCEYVSAFEIPLAE